jgi:hypothetical protein
MAESPYLAAILRDASLRDAPQDEGSEDEMSFLLRDREAVDARDVREAALHALARA